MGVGDIVAAATFAASFGAGAAFWGYVGNCGYSIYLGVTHGWGAFNNPSPWLCAGITAGIL